MAGGEEWLSDRDRVSLHTLSKKFVELMKNDPNGILNLTEVSQVLDVKQKRRIYDITNVLEGIGLITKKSKNTVQWRGTQDVGPNSEPNLCLEINRLEHKEKYLEQLCSWARQNIRLTMSDKNTRTLAYVTRDDLLQCFTNHSVLMLKGHDKAERLPVLDNNTIVYGRGLHVSSSDNPIDVLMATDYGNSMVETSASDDAKGEGTGTAVGVSKRKSKVAPLIMNSNSNTVPDHFEVDREAKDKKEILQRFQEYKNAANMLLNYKQKDPIRDRRLRVRNYYQAHTPFVKLSDNMSSDYQFTIHNDEGVCDLFDIPLPGPPTLIAEDEEMFDEEDAVEEEDDEGIPIEIIPMEE